MITRTNRYAQENNGSREKKKKSKKFLTGDEFKYKLQMKFQNKIKKW